MLSHHSGEVTPKELAQIGTWHQGTSLTPAPLPGVFRAHSIPVKKSGTFFKNPTPLDQLPLALWERVEVRGPARRKSPLLFPKLPKF